MARRRNVPERLLRQARADELRLDNTRPGSQRRAAVDWVQLAERGDLTKRNTANGTAERSAVDAVTYARRAARRAEGETVRAALGHRRPADDAPRALVYAERDGRPVLIHEAVLSRRDLRRAARHLSLIGQLAEGRLSPAAFRARVSGWRPVTVLGPEGVAGTYRFLADPRAVIALTEAVRGEEPEYIRYPNAALRRRHVA